MLDLFVLVPFHSEQVENYNLLVHGQVQNLYKVNKKFYYITINRHLLIGPDAYPLRSIKLHITWAAGFSHSILVTKNRLHRNFP